jgi:hypothetical protein
MDFVFYEKELTSKQRLKIRQIKYDAKCKRDRRSHSDVISPGLGEKRLQKISCSA